MITLDIAAAADYGAADRQRLLADRCIARTISTIGSDASLLRHPRSRATARSRTGLHDSRPAAGDGTSAVRSNGLAFSGFSDAAIDARLGQRAACRSSATVSAAASAAIALRRRTASACVSVRTRSGTCGSAAHDVAASQHHRRVRRTRQRCDRPLRRAAQPTDADRARTTTSIIKNLIGVGWSRRRLQRAEQEYRQQKARHQSSMRAQQRDQRQLDRRQRAGPAYIAGGGPGGASNNTMELRLLHRVSATAVGIHGNGQAGIHLAAAMSAMRRRQNDGTRIRRLPAANQRRTRRGGSKSVRENNKIHNNGIFW